MEISNQDLNHPKPLPILFFAEMWERFSYYGMRALLVLYLVNHLQYSDAQAGHIYGIYTGLVYLTPILGGFLADRFLGHLRSVFVGAFLMLFGHLSLAIEGEIFFYLGLGLLVFGNGFFKPNVSTVLGNMYSDRPGLRDSGFTIFYMGINLGALVGPLATGFLATSFGWHYGFGVAGFGMLLGILVLFFGRSTIQSISKLNTTQHYLDKTQDAHSKETMVENPKQIRDRVFLILGMAFFSIFFWMAFEQMGSSMNLFADRYTDRSLFGWEVPTAWLQSINPLFILVFAPILSLFWKKLAERNKDPHPVFKFAWALFLLGIGFLVMVFAGISLESSSKVSLGFLVVAYFWNTISELFLSPIGLSFVSKTAPAQMISFLMGIWFLSNAFAHYFGGLLSGLTAQLKLSQFFLIFVCSSWLGAFAMLVFGIWFFQKRKKSDFT